MTQLIDDERLDNTFAALANSTRRAILTHLTLGPATVNELAAPFAMTLPAISKHLKVLERAGLVQRTRQAQFRPCELDLGPLLEVSEWAAHQQSVWNARFDQMDRRLAEIQSRTKEHTPK